MFVAADYVICMRDTEEHVVALRGPRPLQHRPVWGIIRYLLNEHTHSTSCVTHAGQRAALWSDPHLSEPIRAVQYHAPHPASVRQDRVSTHERMNGRMIGEEVHLSCHIPHVYPKTPSRNRLHREYTPDAASEPCILVQTQWTGEMLITL